MKEINKKIPEGESDKEKGEECQRKKGRGGDMGENEEETE